MTDTVPVPEYMLTTVDNPFNPFTQFDEWYDWDVAHDYNTVAFLGRISKSSQDLSLADQLLAVQDAIDEIITENVSGMWRKVTKDNAEELLPKSELTNS